MLGRARLGGAMVAPTPRRPGRVRDVQLWGAGPKLPARNDVPRLLRHGPRRRAHLHGHRARRGLAKFPNGIVLNALSLHQLPGAARAVRVRMTFPQSIPVTTVEAAVAELADIVPGMGKSVPRPRFELSDISEKTWDGAIVVWSTIYDEGRIRDSVLRSVLAKLPNAAPGG